MINISKVSHKIQQNTILNNINLSIPKGGITALIGPNGAGKSTLLSLMARLQPLQTGNISYDNHNLADTPNAEIAKILSILTQENSIHSRITVKDLLMFGRYPYHQGKPTQQDHQIVEQAISQFQLDNLANRYLTELSGGQRQRAMIAMVFCQSTEYVLLDEPLNNLDMYYARALMQLLKELTQEHQRTTIIVLHDINHASAYADHIIAMKNGEVAFTGSPEEVFTTDNIQELFNMDVDVIDHKGKKLIIHHI